MAIQLVSTTALARLLDVSDFGVVALVSVVMGFAGLGLDAGLSAATVQAPRISHDQVSFLFWFNQAVGVLLALAVAAASPLAARFFGTPELIGALCLSAVVFPVTSLGLQHRAILARHLFFGRLQIILVTEKVAYVSIAIVMARHGFGYWSIVVGQVFGASLGAMCSWIVCPWLPGPPRRKTGARQLVRFGRNVVGFNVVNYFARNADNVLIGRLLGESALGLYSRSYALLMLPMTPVARPVSAVLESHLSRIGQEFTAFRHLVLYVLRCLSWGASIVFVFLAALSPEAVFILLGDKWSAAAGIVRWLSLAGIVQMSLVTTGSILTASGRPDLLWKLGLATSIPAIGAFLVGLHWGLEGLALAYAISNLLTSVPAASWYLGQTGIVGRLWFALAVLPGVLWWWAVAMAALWARWILGWQGASWPGAAAGTCVVALGIALAGVWSTSAREVARLVLAEGRRVLSAGHARRS